MCLTPARSVNLYNTFKYISSIVAPELIITNQYIDLNTVRPRAACSCRRALAATSRSLCHRRHIHLHINRLTHSHVTSFCAFECIQCFIYGLGDRWRLASIALSIRILIWFLDGRSGRFHVMLAFFIFSCKHPSPACKVFLFKLRRGGCVFPLCGIN